jgi:molybdopterin/thiamine biosynthesis adenylyltransferase
MEDINLEELLGSDELLGVVEDGNKSVNSRTVRFSDAPWYIPGLPILVGGAGAIGSWLTLYLARQDAKLYVYDFDTVDLTNYAGQLYNSDSLNALKVEALHNVVYDFTNNQIEPIREKYTEKSMGNPIVFSAFDNMEARKVMFEKWVKDYATNPKFEKKACIFIDGRLLAESGKIFAVTRSNYEKYRDYLYQDADIKDQPCSFKTTSHSAGIIAGLMTSVFNNYITNVKLNMNVRDVPFLLEYELPIMTFESI